MMGTSVKGRGVKPVDAKGTADRVMVCADLMIGEAGVQSMPVEVFSRWQTDKVTALTRALEAAKSQGARYCVIAGGLFVPGFVPQGLLESCLACLAGAGMPVVYCPRDREAADLESRVQVPPNVRVMRGMQPEPLDCLRVRFCGSGEAELIFKTPGSTVTKPTKPLEPSGFADAQDSGYLLVDVEGGRAVSIEERGCALHLFVSRSVDLTGFESAKQALPAMQAIVETVNPDAALRLVLRGKVKLGVYINADELARYLNKRFFYAEVLDECSVDVDEGALQTDVSLMAELIRQVQADMSLSPVEKSRVIRCAWNALNAKELAE